MNFAIIELYCGSSGKKGYYNSQETGMARAMKKRGYNCFIFYPDTKAASKREEKIEDGITIVYYPSKHIGVHGIINPSLLNEYHLDLVQIGSDNQLYAPNLISYLKKQNIPFYSYIGTAQSDSKNIVKAALSKLLFLRNKKAYRNTLCFSKTVNVRSQLLKLGIESTLMPVGLDMECIPKNIVPSDLLSKEETGEKEVIMYVGRMDPYKRPLMMIDLMRELGGKDYYYVLVGTGTFDQNMQNALDSLNISYKWIKQIPNSQIHSLYAASDYLVNFNDSEIFGMSILEAMYHGITVIACHAPGPDMIIDDSVSGYLVDTISEMASIIKEKKHPDKGTIRAHIIDNFTWERAADTVLSTINI